MNRMWMGAALAAVMLVLSGCGAMHTSVAKRNLDVQTRMSASIFLEPVEPEDRTVFVDIRNTSDKPEFTIRQDIVQALQASGYRVIDSPKKAHYWLQANVLQVGRSDARAAHSALSAGHGVAGGAVTGYAISRATGGSSRDAAVAAVAGAVIGTVVDAMVQDVYYSVITDLQVMERFEGGVVVEDSQHTLQQGTSGSTVQEYGQESDKRKYQTRVMSYANKANLEWEEAAPALRAGLARSIAGLFAQAQ